jgi:hypothetical protein
MDSTAPIPSPSVGWSRVTGLPGEPPAEAERSAVPVAKPREEDAAQLKARLLRMIISNEQNRKHAAPQTFSGR